MSWTEALDSRHSGALLRLHDVLKLDSGFRLVIAAYNNRLYRDKLINELGNGYRQAVVEAKDNPNFSFDLMAQAGQVTLLHITGTDQWFTPDSPLDEIHHLNYQRERLAAALQNTVLMLWLYDSQISQFAHEAPDLWAWRSAVLDFSVVVEPTAALPVHQHWLDAGKADLTEKKQRLESITAYLQGREAYTLADGQLWLEKAQLLENDGLLDEALDATEQCLSIARDYQDKRAECFANQTIAAILCVRGELEQALEIYQQQILPVLSALGDRHFYASALWEIANILFIKGESEQALQIYRHQALPVFEDLGDKEDVAMTEQKIADILLEQGEIEPALEVYKRIIPFSKASGAKSLYTTTILRIGNIKWMLGELKEAVEIYQNQVLPSFEELGDKRAILLCRYNLARLLVNIDSTAHQTEINTLLCQSLQAAQEMRIPETKMILNTLSRLDMQCPPK